MAIQETFMWLNFALPSNKVGGLPKNLYGEGIQLSPKSKNGKTKQLIIDQVAAFLVDNEDFDRTQPINLEILCTVNLNESSPEADAEVAINLSAPAPKTIPFNMVEAGDLEGAEAF